MRGLIDSPEYAAAKTALGEAHPRFGDAVSAAEWELLAAHDVSGYPLVAQTERGPVRSHQIEGSDGIPGIAVVFGVESYRGEEKLLLLDVWIVVESEDP